MPTLSANPSKVIFLTAMKCFREPTRLSYASGSSSLGLGEEMEGKAIKWGDGHGKGGEDEQEDEEDENKGCEVVAVEAPRKVIGVEEAGRK